MGQNRGLLGHVRRTAFELGKGHSQPLGLNQQSPFHYFKTNPGIICPPAILNVRIGLGADVRCFAAPIYRLTDRSGLSAVI